jgi:hypothetical protein
MRFIYVAAAVDMAAVLFMAQVVLMGASPAHADTHGYLRCIKSDAEIPPDVNVLHWLPELAIIEDGITAGKSRADVAQTLAGMGAKRDDAVLHVDCVMANWPIGSS